MAHFFKKMAYTSCAKIGTIYLRGHLSSEWGFLAQIHFHILILDRFFFLFFPFFFLLLFLFAFKLLQAPIAAFLRRLLLLLTCRTHRQCDQKKSPNVYKICPKMISLEKW